jgi:hypothetical protein
MKMIAVKLVVGILLLVWGCGQKPHEHEGHDHTTADTMEITANRALYDEVMKVHDEVMPKMDDIYKLKTKLREKADAASAEKKIEIEATIAALDSASDGMMNWMHTFKPIPDSLGVEKSREYLETEMEKVKKVREDMLQALEKGEAANR